MQQDEQTLTKLALHLINLVSWTRGDGTRDLKIARLERRAPQDSEDKTYLSYVGHKMV